MPGILTNAEGKQLVSGADYLELERLVLEAAWRIDEGRASTFHELYTDDGELVIDDMTLKGREAIKAWGRQLDENPPYKLIRHVAGNMRFVAIDDNTAEGVTILTVFMDDEMNSTVPWVVGEDYDRFIRTDRGWRFASRRWKQLFARPTAH